MKYKYNYIYLINWFQSSIVNAYIFDLKFFQ